MVIFKGKNSWNYMLTVILRLYLLYLEKNSSLATESRRILRGMHKSLCQGKHYPSFLALSASLPSRYLVITSFALILLNFRRTFRNRSLGASGRAWSFLSPRLTRVINCSRLLTMLSHYLFFLFGHLRRPRFSLVSRKRPKSAREFEKSKDFYRKTRFQFRFSNHSTKEHL